MLTWLARLIPAAVFVVAIAAVPSGEGQTARDTDLLAALLTEVRQLRATVDRSAAIAPRIQILLSQLRLQQDRVERLEQRLEGLRGAIARATEVISRNAAELPKLETAIASEPDQKRREALEHVRDAVKAQVEHASAEEQQLRLRETEAQNALQPELFRLEELARKLAELERELAPR